MKIAFSNADIFDGDVIHKNKTLLIKGDKIIGLVNPREVSSDYETHDLKGGLLTAGFVDLQVNGGGGILFNNSPTQSSLETICQAHLNYGTTSIMPTVISDTTNTVKTCVEAVNNAISENLSILGIHIEGPFFNTNRKGVHKPDYIRKPDDDDITFLSTLNDYPVMITLAPEQVSTTQIKTLSDIGIKLLAGHTDATYDTLTLAIQHGLSGFTHLYNAMGNATAREPSVMGTALAHDNTTASIIVDGHHVHPEMVKLAYRCKPKGKLIFVSDAMPSIGGPPEFKLYDNLINEKQGRIVNEEGTLAGSAITLLDAVRIAVEDIQIPITDALNMASRYPADYLGIGEKLGQLKANYIADFIHLDKNLNITKVWKSGLAI